MNCTTTTLENSEGLQSLNPSKAQIAWIILKAIGKHLLRRWYIYATLLVIYVAPFPVVLAVGLGWLGYFNYRLLTLPKEKDTL